MKHLRNVASNNKFKLWKQKCTCIWNISLGKRRRVAWGCAKVGTNESNTERLRTTINAPKSRQTSRRHCGSKQSSTHRYIYTELCVQHLYIYKNQYPKILRPKLTHEHAVDIGRSPENVCTPYLCAHIDFLPLTNLRCVNNVNFNATHFPYRDHRSKINSIETHSPQTHASRLSLNGYETIRIKMYSVPKQTHTHTVLFHAIGGAANFTQHLTIVHLFSRSNDLLGECVRALAGQPLDQTAANAFA